MLVDKRRAQKKHYRIPEAVLLGTALAGGSLGCLLGMYTVRHKTRKPLFYIGFPFLLVFQIILLIVYI